MNATPLDENLLKQAPTTSHKKYGIVIGVVAVFALVLGVVGYTLKSQVTTTQTTTTQARIQCPPIDERTGKPTNETVVVECRDGTERCAEPGGTFDVCGDGCKRVSPCMLKCRTPQGLEQFVNDCEQSPTPVTKQECIAPNICVDPATAQARGCLPSSANAPTCSLDGSISGSGFCCPPDKKVCPSPQAVNNVTISCPKCAQ